MSDAAGSSGGSRPGTGVDVGQHEQGPADVALDASQQQQYDDGSDDDLQEEEGVYIDYNAVDQDEGPDDDDEELLPPVDDEELLRRGVACVLVAGDEKASKLDSRSKSMLARVDTFVRLYKSRADMRLLRPLTVAAARKLNPPPLLCEEWRRPGTYVNKYQFDPKRIPTLQLPAGDQADYSGETGNSCRGRQQAHISKARREPSSQNRHLLAIRTAIDSISLVTFPVGSILALDAEIVEAYGTDFNIKIPKHRVVAFLSSAEAVENAIRRGCRHLYRYNRVLDAILGKPLAGTIGLNGNTAMSNASRALTGSQSTTTSNNGRNNSSTNSNDGGDPDDPDQEVVVNRKLVAMPRASKETRSRLIVLALARTGFTTNVYISAKGQPKTNSVYIPKRILDQRVLLHLHEDDAEALGLPAPAVTRQSITAHIRLQKRIDGGHVTALGTLSNLLFLHKYDFLIGVGDKTIKPSFDRHFIPDLICKLIDAFTLYLGAASLSDLAHPDVAALIKSEVPAGWSEWLYKQSVATALSFFRTHVFDHKLDGREYHVAHVHTTLATDRRLIYFPANGRKVGVDHDIVLSTNPLQDVKKYAIVPRAHRGPVQESSFKTFESERSGTVDDLVNCSRLVVGKEKKVKKGPNTLDEDVALVLGDGLETIQLITLFGRSFRPPAKFGVCKDRPLLLRMVPEKNLIIWLCAKTREELQRYDCTQGRKKGLVLMNDLKAYLANRKADNKENAAASLLNSASKVKTKGGGNGGGSGGSGEEEIKAGPSKKAKRA